MENSFENTKDNDANRVLTGVIQYLKNIFKKK